MYFLTCNIILTIYLKKGQYTRRGIYQGLVRQGEGRRYVGEGGRSKEKVGYSEAPVSTNKLLPLPKSLRFLFLLLSIK